MGGTVVRACEESLAKKTAGVGKSNMPKANDLEFSRYEQDS
jgi:hypothetical protein